MIRPSRRYTIKKAYKIRFSFGCRFGFGFGIYFWWCPNFSRYCWQRTPYTCGKPKKKRTTNRFGSTVLFTSWAPAQNPLDITSHHITPKMHLITSRHTSSHHITPHRTTSHLTPPHPTLPQITVTYLCSSSPLMPAPFNLPWPNRLISSSSASDRLMFPCL